MLQMLVVIAVFVAALARDTRSTARLVVAR
jgi:hypothetical protein